MPVITWITNRTSVPLPKTYHQLAVWRGTRCPATSAIVGPAPSRASSHSPTSRSISDALRQRGELPAQHQQLPVLDLVLVLIERTRRRSGGVVAVRVEHAAVTRAHEQTGALEPAHRTPEVRAVDREDLELVARDAPHPARDVRGVAVPGAGERIAVGRQPGLVLGEIGHRTERDPFLPGPAPRRRQDEPQQRDRKERRGDGVHRAAQREPPPAPAAPFLAHAPPFRCDASPATRPDTCCGARGGDGGSPRQSGMPRSGLPATTAVRSAWSLTSARYAASVTDPPCGVPFPFGSWQPPQRCAKSVAPRPTSPPPSPAYGGRPEGVGVVVHCARISWIRASIWASVSKPPALTANAGIEVPATPYLIARRKAASSAHAMYVGLASAVAGPRMPFTP